jgi:hypothetical protein
VHSGGVLSGLLVPGWRVTRRICLGIGVCIGNIGRGRWTLSHFWFNEYYSGRFYFWSANRVETVCKVLRLTDGLRMQPSPAMLTISIYTVVRTQKPDNSIEKLFIELLG